ncbi:unnamed protein product [Caenorhabditis brenneri]
MSEEKDPFKFVGFSDVIQLENGMATKKEIEELLIFIGGFEKWPLLNEDCRREVVKYLDLQSRFNLGICSKEDQETVEKVKIYVESVEILDNVGLDYPIYGKRPPDSVYVRIRFPNGKSIEWVFTQLEQDTRVRWSHDFPEQRPTAKEVIRKSCDYYHEAVKFAEKWIKKCNFELKFLTVEMAKYPIANSQIKSLPCCKHVRIAANDVEVFEWWLKKVPEQLDLLRLAAHNRIVGLFALPPNLLNSPQVMQASELDFLCKAVFSDEQFLKLKAKSIRLATANVTDKGINQFIKNWVNGKGVNGFIQFRSAVINDRDPQVMIAGLEVEEWDGAFGNEQWKFVEDFNWRYGRPGRRYQIKSKVDRFESLTLSIREGGLGIYATGKRVENNGNTSTVYMLP